MRVAYDQLHAIWLRDAQSISPGETYNPPALIDSHPSSCISDFRLLEMFTIFPALSLIVIPSSILDFSTFTTFTPVPHQTSPLAVPWTKRVTHRRDSGRPAPAESRGPLQYRNPQAPDSEPNAVGSSRKPISSWRRHRGRRARTCRERR